jgi:hypothetical protein
VKSNQPSHLFWLDSLSVINKAALDPVGTEDPGHIYRTEDDVDLKRNDLDITYYRGDHPHYRLNTRPRNQKSSDTFAFRRDNMYHVDVDVHAKQTFSWRAHW